MADSKSATPVKATPVRTSRPVVGKRLRVLFYMVLAFVAFLGANSVYLAGITCLEWTSRRWGAGLTYQNAFYLVMFLLHLLVGLLVILPFVVFGVLHLLAARNRRNRRAVRVGYVLFAVSLLVLMTGSCWCASKACLS